MVIVNIIIQKRSRVTVIKAAFLCYANLIMGSLIFLKNLTFSKSLKIK